MEYTIINILILLANLTRSILRIEASKTETNGTLPILLPIGGEK